VERRDFLIGGAVWAGAAGADAPRGTVLVHEHILVDFAGADKIRPGRYDPDDVFRAALPKLVEIRKLGCRRLQECTPNFLGRDPGLLRRLEEASGIEIWTNTGLYAAGGHKYLPGFARTESAEQLASRWIEEARRGIGGVRPRFIKTGVDKGPLDELSRKIVRAAALASKETGLTVAAHTGDGAAAMEEIGLFREAGAESGKLVWVHAQSERNTALHEAAARAGAWVEFDGIGPTTAAWHLECVRFMDSRGLLGRTLISQDSGWYHVGEPGGGEYRGYGYLYTDFAPLLDGAQAERLLARNPVLAFG
jgi:phosphotriesterase-related protein